MDTNVLLLFFVIVVKSGWCFVLTAAGSNEQDGARTEFPFAKAKIKYHRSRYCITAFGDTNCVRMDEEPGDAAKIAKLFTIWTEGYERNPDNLVKAMLRINDHMKQSKLHRFTKAKKLGQKTKLSQLVKLGELSHKVKQATRSHVNKVSQKVKQRGTESPASWQVAGYDNHVPAIPRMKMFLN